MSPAPDPARAAGSSPPTRWRWSPKILGICPMGMADIPAMDDDKDRVSLDAGELILKMIELDIRPSKIVTSKR